MSFKDTVKASITAELMSAPEMTLVNNFKAFVTSKIAEPAIDLRFIYVYPTPVLEDRMPILNLCAQVGLDNLPVHVTRFAISVETKDILQS